MIQSIGGTCLRIKLKYQLRINTHTHTHTHRHTHTHHTHTHTPHTQHTHTHTHTHNYSLLYRGQETVTNQRTFPCKTHTRPIVLTKLSKAKRKLRNINENSGSTNPDQQKKTETFLNVVTSQKFWLEIFIYEYIYYFLSQFIFLLKLYRYMYYYYSKCNLSHCTDHFICFYFWRIFLSCSVSVFLQPQWMSVWDVVPQL